MSQHTIQLTTFRQTTKDIAFTTQPSSAECCAKARAQGHSATEVGGDTFTIKLLLMARAE